MNIVKNLASLGDPWTVEFGFEKDFNDYRVYSYEWIDRLDDFSDAEEELKSWPLRYVFFARFKDRFSQAGWAGDGKLQLLWLPPFVSVVAPTNGFYVLHVKQRDDGISWIASRYPIVGLEN
jgi:hypothetical protein